MANLKPAYHLLYIKFADSPKGIPSVFRLLNFGCWFGASAVVANRVLRIGFYHKNHITGGNVSFDSWMTGNITASGYGRLNIGGVQFSDTISLSEYGAGGYIGVNPDSCIFAGEEYIRFWMENYQAGDAVWLGGTFEYLNYKYGITEPE